MFSPGFHFKTFFFHQLTCWLCFRSMPSRTGLEVVRFEQGQVLKFSGSSAIAYVRLVSGWSLRGAGYLFAVLDPEVSNYSTGSVFANYQHC